MIAATWTAAENALPFMRKRERVDLFKEIMVLSLRDYQQAFVSKRFTEYVERRPFGYSMYGQELSKAMAALGETKSGDIRAGVGGHGELHDVVKSILLNVTGGWNPWSSRPPSVILQQEWRKTHAGKYKFSVTGKFGGMLADMRAHYKKLLLGMFKNLYFSRIMKPLVLTGDTRGVAMNGKVTAVGRASGIFGKVSVPFPGPRSKRVSAIISTVPGWEVAYISRRIERYFQDRLSSMRRSSQVRWE